MASISGIEANGGAVAKKIRSVNAYTLFGHPNYRDGYGKTATGSATNSIKIESAKYFSSAVAGTYIVATNSDPLMLRTGPGSNRKIITRVPRCDKVQCFGYYSYDSNGKVRWLYCAYKGHRGYLCRAYLRLA